MNKKTPLHASDKIFESENFDIRNLQDEIRVDQLCAQLMGTFYHHLVDEKKVAPVAAGLLSKGTDHFLREFIIPEQCENIFAIPSERVLQFAGNWYIVKTLDPNPKELRHILAGIKAFYAFCKDLGKVEPALAEEIAHNCDRLDYYEERIDSFWAIEEDGFIAWEAECSLKK